MSEPIRTRMRPVNRHERRKRASEERRLGKRESSAPEPAPAAEGTVPPAVLDRLEADVRVHLADGAGEDGARRAVDAASEAMDAALGVVWLQSDLAPACARGCSYCCTQAVSVTAPELLRMVAHARETLAPADLDRLRARAEHNARLTHGKAGLAYPPRLDCAFLGEDRACQAHAVRPLMCRREHAMDVADCKQGYDLAAPGQDHPIVRLVRAKLASDEILDAYHRGLASAGVDAADYELQEAAHLALSNPGAAADWIAGRPVFASARLTEAAAEPGRIPTPRAPRRLPVA
jgi:Fe-S-cluster containining protein